MCDKLDFCSNADLVNTGVVLLSEEIYTVAILPCLVRRGAARYGAVAPCVGSAKKKLHNHHTIPPRVWVASVGRGLCPSHVYSSTIPRCETPRKVVLETNKVVFLLLVWEREQGKRWKEKGKA